MRKFRVLRARRALPLLIFAGGCGGAQQSRSRVIELNTCAGYQAFIAQHPNSAQRAEVGVRLKAACEREHHAREGSSTAQPMGQADKQQNLHGAVAVENALDHLRVRPPMMSHTLATSLFASNVDSFSRARNHSREKLDSARRLGASGMGLFLWWRYVDPAPDRARQTASLAMDALRYVVSETKEDSFPDWALLQLAILYERSGMLTAARDAYERLLLHSSDAELVCQGQLGLAEVAAHAGHNELATRYYENTIACVRTLLRRGQSRVGFLSYAHFALSRILEARGNRPASMLRRRDAINLEWCDGPRWDGIESGVTHSSGQSTGQGTEAGNDASIPSGQVMEVSGISRQRESALVESMASLGFSVERSSSGIRGFLAPPRARHSSTKPVHVAVRCKEIDVPDRYVDHAATTNCHETSRQGNGQAEWSNQVCVHRDGYRELVEAAHMEWDCTAESRVPFMEERYVCQQLGDCVRRWSKDTRVLAECAARLFPVLDAGRDENVPIETLVETCDGDSLGQCRHPRPLEGREHIVHFDRSSFVEGVTSVEEFDPDKLEHKPAVSPRPGVAPPTKRPHRSR